LLDLPDKIQMQIQNGTLTAAHGQALVRIPKQDEQERMAKRIVDHDMTGKRAEVQIERYLSKKCNPKKDQAIDIPLGDVQGIYFKDARKMGELPNKSVHLIVTSPPYFLGMEYEVGVSFKEHLENVEAVIKECARAIVPGGIIALNVSDIANFKESNAQDNRRQIKLMAHFYQSGMKRHKIYLTDEIIWAKRIAWSKTSDSGQNFTEDTEHTSYPIFRNWEPVYIFRAKGERELPPEDMILKSKLTSEQWKAYSDGVWKIEPARNTEGHPCMFPDEMVNRLVRMFSYAGDTVLDPFLGSGTTVKVARSLERVGIGYERELKYKPVIMKKLGLIPDEAKVETTTMVEYAKRSLIDDGVEAVTAAMESVKPSEPKAEFFGRMTQSEETAEVPLYVESIEEFAEVEAVC
jgi:DNA modification methylase